MKTNQKHLRGESWDEQLLLTAAKARESADANNNKTDWQVVKRSVAASAPPRVNDIPSHCKFISKYSGPKNKHLMDMISYLDLAMPEGRIVSGVFLEKLATLKSAPNEMIPRIAHACVIAQACGDKERESCGNTIGDANVKSLTTSCKENALKGEAILNNAYAMLDGAGLDGKRKGTLAVGEFQHDLILFIFGLSDEYEKMDDIMEAFLKKIVTGEGTQPSASTTASGPSMSTAVHYTPDGNDAGRATVLHYGFSIGTVIEPKKVEEHEDIQYAIKYINDDGSVGARLIEPSGGESKDITILDIDTLVKQYRKASKQIALLGGYPDNAAIDSDELQNMIVKGAVAFAIKRLVVDSAYTTMKWRVQKSPKERLVALNAADKKCLRVVPITHKLGTDPSDDVIDVVVVGGVKFLLQRNVSKDCCSEYFIMRVVHDKRDANMEIKIFTEIVEGITVKVACAVNFKDVKANGEVVLFKPAPTKAAAKSKAVVAVLEPPVKKTKMA